MQTDGLIRSHTYSLQDNHTKGQTDPHTFCVCVCVCVTISTGRKPKIVQCQKRERDVLLKECDSRFGLPHWYGWSECICRRVRFCVCVHRTLLLKMDLWIPHYGQLIQYHQIKCSIYGLNQWIFCDRKMSWVLIKSVF